MGKTIIYQGDNQVRGSKSNRARKEHLRQNSHDQNEWDSFTFSGYEDVWQTMHPEVESFDLNSKNKRSRLKSDGRKFKNKNINKWIEFDEDEDYQQ